MHKVEELISEKDIAEKVAAMGSLISKDFKDKDFMVVSVLKGSFIFTADLVRNIDLPLEIAFISASSYEGETTTSSGNLKIRCDIDISVENKTVLLVEDIIDTGLTISRLKEYLYKKGAECVKICTIFDKPDRRKIEVDVDYCGFIIPNEFVVGYGLDYNNKYRNLKNLCKITI